MSKTWNNAMLFQGERKPVTQKWLKECKPYNKRRAIENKLADIKLQRELEDIEYDKVS